MDLINRLKKHWFISIIIMASVCISSTYKIIDILYIQPRDQEIKRQEKIIRDQKEKISDLEKCCNQPCIEYRQKVQQLTKKLNECCVDKFELCKGHAEIIKIDDNSFVILIDNFWEHGTKVTVKVKNLRNNMIKQTRPLQAGDIEKIEFGNITYTFTIIWIKDMCIKALFEKL